MFDFMLYAAWAACPLLFFGMALWGRLEQASGRAQKQNPGDFLRQGVFLIICVAAAYLIDAYALERAVTYASPRSIPLWFYRVLLFPLILLVAAMVIGPSKDIKIAKAPRPTDRKPR